MSITAEEIEKILLEEMDIYTNIEKITANKKDFLIKGSLEDIKNVDFELEKQVSNLEQKEVERIRLSSQCGCKSLMVKELIEKVENQEQRNRLEALRGQIKNITNNIAKLNDVNAQLIKHSLKIIEHSIVSIANALIPESQAYNQSGRVRNSTESNTISSIIEDV